jgi:hypothetical protein
MTIGFRSSRMGERGEPTNLRVLNSLTGSTLSLFDDVKTASATNISLNW